MNETSSAPLPENHETERVLHVEMSGNNLLVGDRRLEPQDGHEILHRALTEGREEIIAGLEDFRGRMQELHPGSEVSLAPFTVVYFGRAAAKRKVLTKEAYLQREQVYSEVESIKEEFHPLWQAVERAGYTPTIRAYYYGPQYDVSLWAQIPEQPEDT